MHKMPLSCYPIHMALNQQSLACLPLAAEIQPDPSPGWMV